MLCCKLVYFYIKNDEITGRKMKYNKQLFDQIETEYNQVLNLCEFIFDNLIEKNDEIKN